MQSGSQHPLLMHFSQGSGVEGQEIDRQTSGACAIDCHLAFLGHVLLLCRIMLREFGVHMQPQLESVMG